MKILLWDIDGTLIRSGRAGSRAMNAAALEVLGVQGAFDGLDFAGRTDPWALATMGRRHGRVFPEALLARFYSAYVRQLRAELHNPQSRVLDGVAALLAHFEHRDDVVQGLLTGNIAAGARAKLEHFDLWRYFAFGAFGDDSGDRNALGPVARERARQHLDQAAVAPTDLVIVGDTPHDVECARAAGAHCAIVATGRFSVEELARHRPDLLVSDFSDPRPLIDFVDRLP